MDIGRPLMRRLVTSERTRARLFDVNGDLVADSRILSRPGGVVQVEELPPPRVEGWFGSALVDVYDWIVDQLPRSEGLPVYKEAAEQTANDYKEVILALAGEAYVNATAAVGFFAGELERIGFHGAQCVIRPKRYDAPKMTWYLPMKPTSVRSWKVLEKSASIPISMFHGSASSLSSL